MQAVILAGGKGTRLKPYTAVVPKPLLPVGDYPILEIVLRQLKAAGVEEVFLAVNHMAQLFQAFFGNGEKYGLNINYGFEEKPLGTAGPLFNLLDRLQENFLVMNGDLLTTLNYAKFYEYHLQNKSAATIAVYERQVKIDFGVIGIDNKNNLNDYIEKPTYDFTVSMGVNIFNTSMIRQFLKKGEYLDIPDLVLKIKGSGQNVACYKEPCYWLDIGRIEDYETANQIFESRRFEFLPE